jgi:hypothetical protein
MEDDMKAGELVVAEVRQVTEASDFPQDYRTAML